MLKEKNMLLTERLHARSTGQVQFRNPMRLKKVKLGMARIKVVLGERKRAFEAAQAEIRTSYEKTRIEDKQRRRAAHIQNELERLANKLAAMGTSTSEAILKGEEPALNTSETTSP